MDILDPIDEQLIFLLEQNARKSSQELAKDLNVSSATVRRRLRNLIKSDVLRITALVDLKKAGFHLLTVIGMSVSHDQLDIAAEVLADYSEVKWIATTTGRFDVMVVATFRSTEALSNFMKKELATIEGIKETETFICLQVKKGHFVKMEPD